MRRFDLFTTGLLEDQPVAWPPLQGEGKPNLLHWATVTLFEELYERISARKLLINRYVYSLETVYPKHLWVTAVCGSGCVWIITWEKTRHEKRAWGDECLWASLLPAVCPELPRSESSSVCFSTLHTEKTIKLFCGCFPSMLIDTGSLLVIASQLRRDSRLLYLIFSIIKTLKQTHICEEFCLVLVVCLGF